MRRVSFCALFLAVAASAQTGDSTQARTVKTSKDPEGSVVTWGGGAAVGHLAFSGGGYERAFGTNISATLWRWLTVSAGPTYAWVTSADSITVTRTFPGRTVSGFTDLPVGVRVSRDLPGDWAPVVGLGFGATLATGDTSTVGSGQTAYGINLSLVASPTDNVALMIGAGRSLANSYATILGSTSLTSLTAGVVLDVDWATVSADVFTNVGSPPAGYDPARSLAGGLSIPVHGDLSLGIDASAGLATGAPNWTFSVGLGTTPAGLAAAAVSPLSALRNTFGNGRTAGRRGSGGRRR